jgi:predicted Zn-dependent protease
VTRSSVLRLSRVAADEVRRAMRQMRAPGFPRPYFVSFLVRDEETWRIGAKFGALRTSVHERTRHAFADVRVGSPSYDQVREGGLIDNDKESESYGYVDLPYGDDADGVRHGLWRLTDARYREAVELLHEKRSRELTYRNPDRGLAALERREPVVDLGWSRFPEVDVPYWQERVERVSAVVKRYPDIKDSHVEFEVEHVCRVFVSSEGARIVECRPIWSIECYLWLLSSRGDAFPWTVKHIVADPGELPDAAALQAEIRRTVARLRLLARAPIVRSFSGPALLEPGPAGLLVHEAVGHRLEGSRLLASGEGQTFKDSLGRLILPPFLSLRDNPRLERFDGRSLVGAYRYDDEGVPASDTALVERGRLRSFMSTRTGIARRHVSNGHARAAYHQRPISRMGVTIVESHEGLTDRELKRVLIEEIHRQKAPFGVRIIEASSGETATDAYNFQAFLGEVNLASRVFPDGREEWIRGINFVGTPLNAIRSIRAAGRRLVVDNSFCGAESGYVPVTTISPALVVSELELQSKAEVPYSRYTFPIPWERAGRKPAR